MLLPGVVVLRVNRVIRSSVIIKASLFFVLFFSVVLNYRLNLKCLFFSVAVGVAVGARCLSW